MICHHFWSRFNLGISLPQCTLMDIQEKMGIKFQTLIQLDLYVEEMWTVGQWEISLGFPFLSRASHTMAGGVKPELRKPACRRNHGCVRWLFNFLFGSYSTLRILLSPLSRKPHKPHNHEILYMISGDLGSLWHCFIWPNHLLAHSFVGSAIWPGLLSVVLLLVSCICHGHLSGDWPWSKMAA